MKKPSTPANVRQEERRTADLIRIVKALEAVGCEVLEIGYYREPANPAVTAGGYFARFNPCVKTVKSVRS